MKPKMSKKEYYRLKKMCLDKVQFKSEAAALNAAFGLASRIAPSAVYICPHCGYYHTTTHYKCSKRKMKII